MHGPGVVGEDEVAGGEEFDELGQGGGAGEGLSLVVEMTIHLVADGDFVAGAEEDEAGVQVVGHGAGGGGETLGGPALGASEGGTGADADDLAGAQAFASFGACGGRAVETDEQLGGEGIDEAGAAEQFEVMEALVGRRVAGLDAGDAISEEPAAGVAIEADTAGNAGEPGGESRVKGVGQDHSEVEVVFFEGAPDAPFFGQVVGAALGTPGDEFVAEGFATVEVGDPGHRQECDFGGGIAFAESA